MRKALIIALLPGCLSLASWSATAEVVCSRGELTRTITVVREDPDRPVPCQVRYDKPAEGVIEFPWTAQREVGYCEAKAEQLRRRLEGFGWQCAGSARTVSPTDADE